jgi:hypothetical protein
LHVLRGSYFIIIKLCYWGFLEFLRDRIFTLVIQAITIALAGIRISEGIRYNLEVE